VAEPAVVGGDPRTRADQGLAHRGFLECFYGRPWTHQERLWLLEVAGAAHLNTYVYGPAADEHTGRRWRERYSGEQLEQFRELVEVARTAGITVCYRVSPAAPLAATQGITFSAEDERVSLLRRLLDLLNVGIHDFVLAYDDLSTGLVHQADRQSFGPGEAGLAAAHSHLANDLLRRLRGHDPQASLRVCPTFYWGTNDSEYRRLLHDALEPNIGLLWTGPEVVSHRLTTSQTADFVRQAGARSVWVWDNYPVNDWGNQAPIEGVDAMHDLLLLGPLDHRSPGVAAQVDGYLVNGAIQAAITHPVLLTAAEWMLDPTTYDPQRAWQEALTAIEAPPGPLANFCAAMTTSPLQPRQRSAVAPGVWQLLGALDSGADVTAHAQALTGALTSLEQDCHRLLAPASTFASAARPWIEETQAQCRNAALAVQVITAATLGDAPTLRDAGAHLQHELTQWRQRQHVSVVGGSLLSLIERGRLVAGVFAPQVDLS
jgi:hyaluronoglucosaminidase